MKKAILIILKKAGNFKELELLVFKFICSLTRSVLGEILELVDEEFMEERDKERLKYQEKRDRTIMTLFGPLKIERRYYYDKEEEEYKFLLDDYLNIPSHDRKSPLIKEFTVLMLKDESYRNTAEKVSEKAEGSVSHTAIWNWIQQLGSNLRQELAAKKEDLFEWGTLPPGEGEKEETDYLYTEADGTYIYLQNEDKDKGEIKLGITYEDWEKRHPMSDEHKLVNKKYYGGEFDSTEFWKGLETKVYENYDPEVEFKTILNGDGAPWIDTGEEYLPKFALRNLDEFHINQAIFHKLGGGSKYIERVQKAIENEDKEALKEHLQEAKSYRTKKKDKEKVEELKEYLLGHWENLIDYRKRDLELPEDAQGMGGIESNIDKIIANRFKKKGMRWTKEGVKNLIKIIIAEENGKLEEKIEQQNWYFKEKELEKAYTKVEEKINNKKKSQKPPQKGKLPVIEGPHAGKDWVKVFKKIANPILNNPIDKGIGV